MALQETRWQDKDIMYTKSHTLFYSGKEEGTTEFGVVFVVERNMKRNVLDFKAVEESICVSRIKTRFQNVSFINVHAPTDEKEEPEKEASIKSKRSIRFMFLQRHKNSAGGPQRQSWERRNLSRINW
jgi:exonuclease III